MDRVWRVARGFLLMFLLTAIGGAIVVMSIAAVRHPQLTHWVVR